jgi:hypothetical protein
MSLVMVRMLAQLSRRASVAAGPPCTIIFLRGNRVQYANCDPCRGTDQFSGGDFWNDGLGCPTIVETLEVNEEQATGKLHFHHCRDVF